MSLENLVESVVYHSAAQVILEVPERLRLVCDEVNLNLLKMCSEEASKELLIQTTDPLLRLLAQQAGIPLVELQVEPAAIPTKPATDGTDVVSETININTNPSPPLPKTDSSPPPAPQPVITANPPFQNIQSANVKYQELPETILPQEPATPLDLLSVNPRNHDILTATILPTAPREPETAVMFDQDQPKIEGRNLAPIHDWSHDGQSAQRSHNYEDLIAVNTEPLEPSAQFSTAEWQTPLNSFYVDPLIAANRDLSGPAPHKNGEKHLDNQQASFAKTKPPRPSLNVLPALVVGIIILLGLALAGWWFMIPQATVVIAPKEETLSFVLDLQIATAIEEANYDKAILPAKRMEKSSRLELQKDIDSSRTVGVSAASGKVTLANRSAQNILLPRGTVLTAASGVRFLTDDEVVVPKKTIQYQGDNAGEAFGMKQVTITAESKGSSGNLPPNSIVRVEGRYQNSFKIIQMESTYGGADARSSVVTPNDIRRCEAEARQRVVSASAEQLASLMSKDYLILPSLTKSEIIRIATTPAIGSESKTVTTEIEYKATILAPQQAAVQRLITERFAKRLPENFQTVTGSIELIEARVIAADTQQAKLRLYGRGRIRSDINADQIVEFIKGKPLDQAREMLSKRADIATFAIELPTGHLTLPENVSQIKVVQK